jgi:hypothetical protein
MFNGDIKQVQSHIVAYMVYLKQTVAYSTRNVVCSVVFTFYTMNDIIINKKRLYRYFTKTILLDFIRHHHNFQN